MPNEALSADVSTDTAGLYVHIPFCKTKCPYCDFYSITRIELSPQIIRSILAELDFHRESFPPFDTIYIGGGTPSVLGTTALASLVTGILERVRLSGIPEITIEINPDDTRELDLAVLVQLGVNRISLGCQALHDRYLRFLERRHNVNDVYRSIERIRSAGINNLGLDFIYGLPQQSLRTWQSDLVQIARLGPDHISCYQLTIHPGTPFANRRGKDRIIAIEEEKERAFFIVTSHILKRYGYLHYEISNFARSESYFSRHNYKYWTHQPYLGLGPAAHSCLNRRRWWNVRDVRKYIRMLPTGNCPEEGHEILSDREIANEQIFLGLRTNRGVPVEKFSSSERIRKQLEIICRNGLGWIEDGWLRLSPEGMAVADRLAADLIDP